MNLRPDSTALAVPVAVNPVDVAGPLPARTEPAVAETEVQTPAQTAPRQTQTTWQASTAWRRVARRRRAVQDWAWPS